MTVFTRARHSSSCARWAQSTPYGLRSYKYSYLPSCPYFYKIRQFIWYSWIISLFKFGIWSLISKQICIEGVRENILIWGGKKRWMEKLAHQELRTLYSCG
jgi:hypothetical protein